MLRMARKVKKVKREVQDPFYGKGVFIQEHRGKATLQYQNAEGDWVDVPTVDIEEEEE